MRVTVSDANHGTEQYDLDGMGKANYVFGRQQDCDIVLRSSFISRPHGVIVKENGAWYVQDMNSTYGLFWRGRKVDKVPVTDGTEVRIYAEGKEGDRYVELRFTETSGASQGYSSSDDPAKKSSGGRAGMIVGLTLAAIALIVGLVLFFVMRSSAQEKAVKNTLSAFSSGNLGDIAHAMLPDVTIDAYEKNLNVLKNGISLKDSIVQLEQGNFVWDVKFRLVEMGEMKEMSVDDKEALKSNVYALVGSSNMTENFDINKMYTADVKIEAKGTVGEVKLDDWKNRTLKATVYEVNGSWYAIIEGFTIMNMESFMKGF